ncbi:MAG: transposase [Elusimicrobiales bacterium]|nr:transposase [Elusimicrobiales bacterium]
MSDTTLSRPASTLLCAHLRGGRIMARIARVVVPGYPHHVTQRGNRRQRTFFCDADCRLYLSLMSEWCGQYGVEIWGYCLMPNHIHLIAVPRDEVGLRLAIGEAHRRYTRHVNFREGWRGHLWQERFFSFVMDTSHLLAAARYVDMNPVRGGLVPRAEDYPWSSAAAHLRGKDDALAHVSKLTDIVGDWSVLLDQAGCAADEEKIRACSATGRPFGGEDFIIGLEQKLGRSLHKGKPGRRPAGVGI